MAIQVSNFFYHKEEKLAQLLLKKVTEYGTVTCFQLAISANLKKFVSELAFQKCLTMLEGACTYSEKLSNLKV